MFEVFEANFSRDPPINRNAATDSAATPDLFGLREFFEEYGGSSFASGLYRTLQSVDVVGWQQRIGVGFSEFEDRAICFGYDWAGGVFALDTERLQDGYAGVILLEPGTGKALRLPFNLFTFHNIGLIESAEAVLGVSFYENWRATGGPAPSYGQCVGYRRPLFLGGSDVIDNLEVSDLDVYWHLMGQLIQQTRGLPPGTPVQVSLD
jgi:hypothetical protein